MTHRGRTATSLILSITSLVFLVPIQRSAAQESKAEWLKKFKEARYVVFSWEGSIERYQLGLLADSLKGSMVDNMINWRERARQAVAGLKGCRPEYQGACQLLEQIIDLLSEQESLCTGKAYIMAHLEEWRANKEKIRQLHKELSSALDL